MSATSRVRSPSGCASIPTPTCSLAHTLTDRRSHLAHRAAVVAGDRGELLAGLDALVAGEHSPAVAMGAARTFGDTDATGPVWVFSGHGAQWSGMGQELLRTEPAFARVIDELGPIFAEELGWTPREAIDAGGPWTVTRTQAMTFAMQVALAEVWSELGLSPGAVIGHSVGEIAAATVAGSLDRADAARFACRRARALEQVAGRGAMAMVPAAFDEVERRLAGRDGVVAGIAASPLSTVVSGDIDAVEALVAEFEADGIKARKVNTDVAFHSPHVRGAVLDEVRRAADQLHARAPQVTLYSTAQTDPRSGAAREGEYWATNLAEPVRFHQAVRAALDDGNRVFLEVSSHPVVAHSITETALDAGVPDAQVAITLRRDEPEQRTAVFNLAKLHCLGTPVSWSYPGDLVDVPAVRWQHRPFWIFPDTPAEQGAGRGHDPETHTLIGGHTTVASAPVQRVWQTELDMSNRPYAQSHKVVGVETVPASVVLNSFIGAAAGDSGVPFGLRDIVFRIPLAAHPTRVVQLVMEQDKIRLASRIKREEGGGGISDDEWLTHTTATVVPEPVVGATPMEDVDVIRARCPESWTWEKVDDIFRGMGVDGYTFPWEVQELLRGDGEQITTVQVDHTPKRHPSSWTAVVDAALTVSGVRVMTEDSTVLRTCSHLESLSYRGAPPARITVHTTYDPRTPDTINMVVADESGKVVCEARGLRYVKVQDIGSGAVGPRDLVHELTWERVTVRPDAPAPRQALLVGLPDGGPALVEALAAQGVEARAATDAAAIGDGLLAAGDVVIVAPPALLPGEAPEQAARRCTAALVDAVQRIAGIPDEQRRPTVWVLTRGVREGDSEAALAHAPLWGAGRIVAGERPDLWGGTIDVGGDGELAEVAGVIGALPPNEDVLSYTADGLFAARLQRVERPAERESVECRPDGTYLVTGGLGALGLEAARYLVEQGARRLVLVGRRGLPPRSEWDQVSDPAVAAQVAEVVALEAAGATVRVLRLDISDPEATARALEPGALDLPPVRGIVHCAGVVSDALVEKTGAANLDTTMGPKADGAMVLHRLFPAGTLDFFTMFSSCGQFARLTGQLVEHWRFSTDRQSTGDELAVVIHDLLALRGIEFEQIDGEAVSSVVPRLVSEYREMFERYLDREALILGPGTKTGMPILLENPARARARSARERGRRLRPLPERVRRGRLRHRDQLRRGLGRRRVPRRHHQPRDRDLDRGSHLARRPADANRHQGAAVADRQVDGGGRPVGHRVRLRGAGRRDLRPAAGGDGRGDHDDRDRRARERDRRLHREHRRRRRPAHAQGPAPHIRAKSLKESAFCARNAAPGPRRAGVAILAASPFGSRPPASGRGVFS